MKRLAAKRPWRRWLPLASAGSLLLAHCGCATIDPELQRHIDTEAQLVTPSVEDDDAVFRLGLDVAAGRAPEPEPIAIDAGADLETYVAAALERNPAIHRAIREVQALGYRVPQVTSLEDPMITLLPPIGDMTETAAGMVDARVGISQQIPFPGRLQRRGQVGQRSVRMAFASLADTRIRIASEVSRAYYDYYLTHVSTEILRSSEALVRRMRDVASARYRSGSATQQDVLRAEVELYTLADELITLEQRHATARARLNTLIHRAVDAPLPPPGEMGLEAVEWKLSQALDRAVADNPGLDRLREQVHRDLESIRLARLAYYPDLRAGFSHTFIGSGISPVASGADNWDLPLGINLPIWWRRLRAGVLEANATTLASIEQLEDARNTIAFGVQDTLVKLDTQYRRALLFRDLIVPRALQTIEVSTAAYRSGQLEFTPLMESCRAWLDHSLAYYRAVAAVEQRFADLQQLIGVRVPRRPDADEQHSTSRARADAAAPSGARP